MLRFAIVAAVIAAVVVVARALRRRRYWQGNVQESEPLVFLNLAMAMRETVLGHHVPTGYRQASAFFGTGLIDRTGTLFHGFPVRVLDPIPQDFAEVASIDSLCAQRAEALVAEARDRGLKLRLLWSGGIDSTCVAVALLQALGDDRSLLEVFYTRQSVEEYPLFRKLLVKNGVKMKRINLITEALNEDVLNVTGEHGDQIFGSMLAERLHPGSYRAPWRSAIPALLPKTLRVKNCDTIFDYLEPQIATCPIPIETAFDWLWWANFSMKWQAVSQRMLVPLPPEKRARIEPVMRHFFGTDDFQRWALANPDKRIRDTWESYKWPLKDIIYDFTGDAVYRDTKTKERSLRLAKDSSRSRVDALAMTAAGLVLFQPIDWSLVASKGSSGFEFDLGE